MRYAREAGLIVGLIAGVVVNNGAELFGQFVEEYRKTLVGGGNAGT